MLAELPSTNTISSVPTPAPISTAHTRLWLPRLALAGCVRAALLRNTIGVELSEAQRYNHFPASPLVSLSWWFTGSSDLLDAGFPASPHSPRQPCEGRFVIGGPYTRPGITHNRGPVHAMMLLMQPDALHALTGIDPQAHVNRISDASLALPANWLAMCEAVQHASDDDSRFALIEAFLLPLWSALKNKPGGTENTRSNYADWAQGLALRAATSSTGRSLRQVERRIKQWAGLPLRELRALSRAEKAFFQTLMAAEEGPVNWAAVAEEGGYADQSHLCRESRRVTGFSPQQLRLRIETDESFWAYRIWE
jgi:AraC-like DNA-binding protein